MDEDTEDKAVRLGILIATACLMIEPCLPAEVMSPMLTSHCV